MYPGTFDPVTYGHLDVIRRASRIFDEVIVAVADSSTKTPLFSVPERLGMLRAATRGISGITVDHCQELLVNYVRRKEVRIVIRGLRMVSDFEYEFQMALTNRKLDAGIEIIFMMPHEAYSFLSSSLIKEIARLGADVSDFVPPLVVRELKRVFGPAASRGKR
jgi:pantetheine-phosphate adenylyltransferase